MDPDPDPTLDTTPFSTDFKGTVRPDRISLRVGYHWKGLEEDINRHRFLIFDFWF
jgi:hypothetical protein